MSTYSRSRKNACRTLKLTEWPITRAMFKRSFQTTKTWKSQYKKYKKSVIKRYGRNVFKLGTYSEMRKSGRLWIMP